MQKKFRYMLLAAALLPLSAFGERTQTLQLDTLTVPKRWTPAESTVTLAQEKFGGHPVLKWEAPVDHFKGETKYLVGWPRTYFVSFKRQPEVPSDWSQWDNFEFEIRVKLENDDAKKGAPMTLHLTTAPPAFSMPLKNLNDGKIHTISLPIMKLKDPSKVVRFGFSISESNYKHGAKLTVWAGNFRLIRSSECVVKKLELLTPAVMADGPSLKLKLLVAGPAGDVARGVPFELKNVKSGKVIRRETLPVVRGERELEVDLHELAVEPGDYTMTVFPGNKEKSKSVVFKVLPSPYQVKK